MALRQPTEGHSAITGKAFKLGGVYQTRGLSELLKDPRKAEETVRAFLDYINGDWGDLTDPDKQMNEDAIETEKDRILAAYNLSFGKVYIITEWDRSYTTLMLADEY